MHQITVGEFVVNVVRKDIKNLHLAVYPPDGRIRIATPLKIDDEAVRLFVISKIPWIRKNRANLRSQERQSAREYVSGESHYFNGNRYLLNVICQDSKPIVGIRNKTYIDLYVKEGYDLRQRRKIMIEWYRNELKKNIPVIIAKWEKVLKVQVNDWGVKQMKTRWGTCNINEKRIWLNLELAKKPKRCLEYIIVHEMLHLFERYHNERFVKYLNKYFPQWRFYKEELNRFPISHTDWKY